MIINQAQIHRWIYASIAGHFDDNKDSRKLFVESEDRDTNKNQEWLELRIDGPLRKEVSKGCFWYNMEINILASRSMDEGNYHDVLRLMGVAEAAFVNKISVFKLGTDTTGVDDQSFIGCLVLQQDQREAVISSYFGQIDPEKRLLQGTVEGHYRMELQEG